MVTYFGQGTVLDGQRQHILNNQDAATREIVGNGRDSHGLSVTYLLQIARVARVLSCNLRMLMCPEFQ
jgi:hypothetical protein